MRQDILKCLLEKYILAAYKYKFIQLCLLTIIIIMLYMLIKNCRKKWGNYLIYGIGFEMNSQFTFDLIYVYIYL